MLLAFLRRRRAYIFPAVLFLMLIIFTAGKISGSSIGIFYATLYGQAKDPNLIVNQPRMIRSDEWEVNTPLLISQVQNGFPRVNTDIGNGQDMSMVLDVPYKEWSALFKPHNWSFFVLPLEYAFAFKWWLLGCLLMFSCYLFCLAVLPKKYLLASLVSAGLFLSPFVQWWYLSGTILSLAYGLLIAFIGIRLFSKKLEDKNLWLWTALLAYVLTCFSLILYIPFIMPVALVVGGFLLGHVINLASAKADRERIKKPLIFAIIAAVFALSVCLVFLRTRSAPIQALRDTVYPGQRVDESGGFDFQTFSGGPFNMQLQFDGKAANFPLNQSEASSFIYIFPFLVPAAIYFLAARKGKKHLLDWRLIALLFISALFLIRLFVPFSDFIFDALLFNRVPHTRLVIGFGIINIMMMVLIFEKLQNLKQNLNPVLVWSSALAGFLYTLYVGFSVRSSYPGYLASGMQIGLVAITIGLVTFLILRRRLVPAMVVLVAFSLVSVVRINPLYRGLSPIVNSELSQAIQETGDGKGKWVVSEDVIFENVVLANKAHALSGVYAYPQLELWKSLERSPEDEYIYNRYAHVFFTVEKVDNGVYPQGAYLDPPATDAFRVHADPCSNYFKQQDVAYVLTASDKSDLSCLEEVRQIRYPALSFKIYEVR